MLMNVEVYDVALIPATMGLVEVAKSAGLPSKYAPIVSLVIGIALGVATSLDNIGKGIIVGIAIGLSASGLYSGTKTLTKDVGQ